MAATKTINLGKEKKREGIAEGKGRKEENVVTRGLIVTSGGGGKGKKGT